MFGGWTDDSFETNDVEIIDVLSDSRPCQDPTSMPVAREASEAQLMNDNTILVCGGRYRDDCDRYDVEDDFWLPDSFMNTPR